MVVDPEGPMSAGRRGALGVANSNGCSRTGGGGWRSERGELLSPAECPWHPSQSREAGGRLIEMGDRGRQGWQHPLPERRGQCGGEVQGGPYSPCSLPSGLRSSWGNVRERQCSSLGPV